MASWILLASVADCPPGSARELVVGDRIVALYRVDDQFYALDGICPHQGGPLGKGRLHDGVVTCPWHGWQFDVRTGQHQSSKTLCHPRYELKIEDGQVWMQVESP
ncbi:MAG: Rieske (2Fe-2S) protein [Planctomycetota bacterium]